MVAGRGRRLPILVVGVGVLLVLTAGTVLVGPRVRDAISATGSPHTTPTPGGSAAASAAAQGEPTGSVDDSTRRVMVNGASMVLPADPFDLTPDPVTVEDVFDVCFLAEATVHPRSGSAPGWAAMVGLAHLDPALERQLGSTGAATALQMITREFFGSYPTRLTDVDTRATTVSGHTALRITAKVHYTVPGLASTHDEVTAVVVDLGDQGTVVAMTSVPDDAPKQIRRMAAQALGTLAVG